MGMGNRTSHRILAPALGSKSGRTCRQRLQTSQFFRKWKMCITLALCAKREANGEIGKRAGLNFRFSRFWKTLMLTRFVLKNRTLHYYANRAEEKSLKPRGVILLDECLGVTRVFSPDHLCQFHIRTPVTFDVCQGSHDVSESHLDATCIS